jgi:hypothetical protein
LDDEGEFDYFSCGEMGISQSSFSRIKAEAIGILAAALKLTVSQEIKGVTVEVG